jgi:hypothetical protein
MDNQNMNLRLTELRGIKAKLDEIMSEFAEDSDDDLNDAGYEYLFGASENLRDALQILKNKM